MARSQNPRQSICHVLILGVQMRLQRHKRRESEAQSKDERLKNRFLDRPLRD
jgi:hypothetical protein